VFSKSWQEQAYWKAIHLKIGKPYAIFLEIAIHPISAPLMFLAGLSFSWENALYALVMLYISGVAAEVALEGSNVVRTALIITSNAQAVTEKSSTRWSAG
jgi:uncharacterized membrane-anchored protein YitT (DUF2179 family)